MTKRNFHVGLNSSQESWRTIRSLRADPLSSPRQRMSPERNRVFQTALEQAQQQFVAAASIGYESRPLNLFYGLSQAGRAIAAASSLLGFDEENLLTKEWQGRGHGLQFNPELRPGVDLFASSVKVASARGTRARVDLFSRISVALDSPTDFGEVPLAQILAQIPEYRFEFEDISPWWPELHAIGIYALVPFGSGPHGFQIWLPTIPEEGPFDDQTVLNVTDRYPALRDFKVWHNLDATVPGINNDGTVTLAVPSLDDLRRDSSGSYYLPIGTSRYRGRNVIFPTIGDSRRAAHPLALWWLILYSLSMIARYSPSDWTASLTLSTSPIASKIEHILDVALDAVPDLIAETLQTAEQM